MKCPEWLLEALAKGEGVKCKVWDDDKEKAEVLTVTGFQSAHEYYFFAEEHEEFFENAEPYKEPEHEFKPFDKVLVRDDVYGKWLPQLYWCNGENSHVSINGGSWKYCIPYEGNEHLLGTTDNAWVINSL